MTTADSGTEQPAPPPARPLLRSRDDRVLAGVAGGLGRWLDVDPVIFRVTFGLLTLFGGLGIIAYLIGYLLIPDESTGEALVSSRLLPDLRRLTHQQRALLGWGAAGICVLIAIAGHRSTTVAVLIIVAAVAVLSARAATPSTQRLSRPRSSTGRSASTRTPRPTPRPPAPPSPQALPSPRRRNRPPPGSLSSRGGLSRNGSPSSRSTASRQRRRLLRSS
jgi:phage shock protein PspC (stress-responsive transcriptional regulator)